jgi:molecular chaperone GrpE
MSEAQKKAEQDEVEAKAEQSELVLLRAENARLKEENARDKETLRREHESYLRALADFDNFRKRVERERSSAARAGKRDLVLALLNVLDDFERALKHLDESPASVAAGLHAMHRRLAGLLEAQGVKPFESVGQPFDPALHEAIGSVESDGQEPGTVLDEMQSGYRWGEELLRPARVRVVR